MSQEEEERHLRFYPRNLGNVPEYPVPPPIEMAEPTPLILARRAEKARTEKRREAGRAYYWANRQKRLEAERRRRARKQATLLACIQAALKLTPANNPMIRKKLTPEEINAAEVDAQGINLLSNLALSEPKGRHYMLYVGAVPTLVRNLAAATKEADGVSLLLSRVAWPVVKSLASRGQWDEAAVLIDALREVSIDGQPIGKTTVGEPVLRVMLEGLPRMTDQFCETAEHVVGTPHPTT